MEEIKPDAVLSQKILTFRKDSRIKYLSSNVLEVSKGQFVGIIQIIGRKLNYELSSIGDQMVQTCCS